MHTTNTVKLVHPQMQELVYENVRNINTVLYSSVALDYTRAYVISGEETCLYMRCVRDGSWRPANKEYANVD